MRTFFQDIRYGVRGLLHNRAFTVVAVLSLALGIGANTAIFSLVNAVLFKSLPLHEPEKLVMLWEDASFANFPRNTPAPANYVDWKTQNKVFSDMAALDSNSLNITGDGEPERVSSYSVTPNFFPLLGVEPLLGRSFTSEEDKSGANNVVIISHGLWQSRYGGQQDIINRDILLNDQKYKVVGVMPANFQFLGSYVKVWTPLTLSQEEWAERGSHYLTVVARLKQGVTLEQARADMQTIMQRIATDHPQQAGKLKSVVLPLREQLAGDMRQPLVVLMVAVGFVLLIACANIASLLLTRAASRRKEIAVRTAMGASRWRIVRQLLTESILLSLAGGVLGLLLAMWSFAFLQQLIPEGMLLITKLQIDWRIFIFTLSLSVITGILFGLVPAWQAAKVDLNETLKQYGGRSGSSASNRLRGAMVITEIALALILLVGAGLLIQTLFNLHNQYSLLKPENLLTVRTALPLEKYDEAAKRVVFYDAVLERVKNLPGVVSAAYTTTVPLEWKGGSTGFTPENFSNPISGLSYDSLHRQISSDYLQTIGVRLKEGRYFTDGDNQQSLPVVIINETMARQYWEGESPIGKRFKLGNPESKNPLMTIVGVTTDVKQMGLDLPVKSEMYIPYKQMKTHNWYAPRDLVIRTNGDPLSLTASVRHAVQTVDPDQPVSNIRTMSEILGEETSSRRVGMLLLAAFAVLALLLASIGIYGVLAYFVTQHTSEIGVRMALGASQNNILQFVLRKGLKLILPGVAIGLLASVVLTRLMASLLFGVKANDPFTFAGIALLLMFVALLACYLPARRATKVDPMIALRYE